MQRVQNGWTRISSTGSWIDDKGGEIYAAKQVRAALDIIDGVVRSGRTDKTHLTFAERRRFNHEVMFPSLPRVVRFARLYDSLSDEQLMQMLAS